MATPKWRMTLNRARGHATQTCSLWRVSSHSSKTELSQTFPAMNRKEYTQRHLLNQGQRKPPFHPTPPLQAGRAKSPSAAPRPWRVCRLCGSGLGGSSALYLWLLYWRAIHFHRMGRKLLRLQWGKMERKKPQRAIILRALLHSFYTAQILTICTKHRSSYGIF